MSWENSDVAYAAIVQLNRALRIHGFTTDEATEKFAITRTLFQHGAHLKAHRVQQDGVDPYKIVCWYGFSLIDALDLDLDNVEELETFRSVCMAMISTLEGFLNLESEGQIIFPARTRTFLYQLLLHEQKGNGDHGIGKNGLYASFHCTVAALHSIQNKQARIENI